MRVLVVTAQTVAAMSRIGPSPHHPRSAARRRPIPDLIIAAAAEPHQVEVLHVDSDYDMIAKVTGQTVRRALRVIRSSNKGEKLSRRLPCFQALSHRRSRAPI